VRFVSERAAQHLADHCLRQFGAEFDLRGHLVGGQLVAAERPQLRFGGRLAGAQHHPGPDRLALVRIGNAGYVVPELSTYAVAPHDLYLLCSDGLTDMLTDEQIAQVLHAFQGDMQRAAEALIDEANREGGVDNISLILARMPGVTVSGAA